MGIHYKIYQIDMNLDTAFRELKEIGKPNPANYLLVYEGEMPGKADAGQTNASGDLACLEKLFQIFNVSIPSDYKSRSMSVSDVIALCDDNGGRFYYCDSVGFEPVEFDMNKEGSKNGAECTEKTEGILARLKINRTPRRAIHVKWAELDGILSDLLSACLGRKIAAYSERYDFCGWLIKFNDTLLAPTVGGGENNTPLKQTELEKVFSLAEADDYDRDQNDYGEYPVHELCQGAADKLMNKLLPYIAGQVIADDEGVWFISSESEKNHIKKELPDGAVLIAETCDEPEYPGVRVSLVKQDEPNEIICFVEYNGAKPVNKELCIAAYSSDNDEPVYYESYNESQPPSQSV